MPPCRPVCVRVSAVLACVCACVPPQLCGVHKSGPDGLVATILRSLKDRNVHKQSMEVEPSIGKKWI